MDQLIAINIKRLRIIRDMSQIDLAAKLGVSRMAVCHWEKAHKMPSQKRLSQLSTILKVPIKEITGENFGY